MNKSDKEKWVKFLTGEFGESKIVIFAEFLGLSVKEMEELRKETRKNAAKIRVVKNNLVKKAFQSLSRDEACKFMEGPNMLIWSKTGDESDILKGLIKFAKTSGKVKVKFGILNDAIVESAMLEQLSRLPSKKMLQAIVIGKIMSPFSALVYNVKYPVSRLILTLKTFSEKKGAGNE
jgi:large subunit ribosomal protein L10